MRHRAGGAVRVVLDRVGIGVGKAVSGVKAGDLDDALEVKLVDSAICDIKEIVVCEEIVESMWMDKKRRLAIRLRIGQPMQLAREFFKQRRFTFGGADDVPDFVPFEHASCERAEIEPDDKVSDPAARVRDDGRVIHHCLRARGLTRATTTKSLSCPNCSISK